MKGHGTVLEPLDIQLHVNPVSLAVGAVGGLFAIGLGWLAYNGLQGPFGPIIPGLKEGTYWGPRVDHLVQVQNLKRDCKRLGGTWNAKTQECTYPSGIVEGVPG